ncbi:MAG: GNAT family N-acetyltransferase [Actinomycetota bacterium]|nr:GNAT family N-acetyltransferase [Actinomycetota bacterium]
MPKALAELEIRPFRHEDAAPTIPLFREVWPEVVVTPPGLVHFIEQQPERAAMRAWVADAGGEIVAFADARMRWALAVEGIAGVWVGVVPAYRRRGLGSRLYELAEAHLVEHGARRLESTYRDDEPEVLAFAQFHGFDEGKRKEQFWALRVEPAVAEPQLPSGVRVARLREVREREHALFDLYNAAERDAPDDYPRELVFDEWLPETLGNPELDLDLSAVVLVDDRPASFAWLISDREGGRAANEMTGTAPAFRRRGLARLAKEATIRWAAEAGIQTILTSNDTTNADMLALNEHLGYQPTVLHIDVAKDV